MFSYTNRKNCFELRNTDNCQFIKNLDNTHYTLYLRVGKRDIVNTGIKLVLRAIGIDIYINDETLDNNINLVCMNYKGKNILIDINVLKEKIRPFVKWARIDNLDFDKYKNYEYAHKMLSALENLLYIKYDSIYGPNEDMFYKEYVEYERLIKKFG